MTTIAFFFSKHIVEPLRFWVCLQHLRLSILVSYLAKDQLF